MQRGAECQLFQHHPEIIKDDHLNKALCEQYQKLFKEACSNLKDTDKGRPTSMLKAFYECLNLINLYPLLEPQFDVEIGNEAWKKAIGKYQNYGMKQEVAIPSFDMLNALFDPDEVI